MLENIVDILIDKVGKEVVTDESMKNIPLAYYPRYQIIH